MPSVAEQLRAGRELLKLDIYQVAEATKIRTDHIRALEAGDYDQFVAPVYIRGFVRTYSRLLKLDVPTVMATLDGELRQTRRFAEAPALTKQPKSFLDAVMLRLSRLNWRLTLLSVGFLLVVAAIGWSIRTWQDYKRTDPLQKLGPGMYQSRTDQTADHLPIPTNTSHKGP